MIDKIYMNNPAGSLNISLREPGVILIIPARGKNEKNNNYN
jgi:hypothetical protein